MEAFKDAFGRNYRIASEKFSAAVQDIDKSIARLNKVKENLLASENPSLNLTRNLPIKLSKWKLNDSMGSQGSFRL